MLSFIVASTYRAASAASSAGTPAAARPGASVSGVSFSITCSPTSGVCQSFATLCHSYSGSSGAPPTAQVRISVGSSDATRSARMAPQSCATRSTGPPRLSTSLSNQSQYASLLQSNPGGTSHPNHGSATVTPSSRRSRRINFVQTRCVSATPFTNTVGISSHHKGEDGDRRPTGTRAAWASLPAGLFVLRTVGLRGVLNLRGRVHLRGWRPVGLSPGALLRLALLGLSDSRRSGLDHR